MKKLQYAKDCATKQNWLFADIFGGYDFVYKQSDML